MPAYNVENYIREAVRSLQCQTVRDWQLVIVNDGSTDSTLSIALTMQEEDCRIRVLSMEKASGSAYQPRKKAILESLTEWVAPLDADDWVAPDYLRKLIDRQAATNADIVYPTMWDPGLNSGIPFCLTPTEPKVYENPLSGIECLKYTLDGWRINCNGGIIRKELYSEAFKRFVSSLTYSCADELLTRQLLSIAPKVAFSQAKYFYRPNEESITRKKSAKLFDFLINTQTLIPFVKEIYGEKSEEYLLAQRQNFHGYFDALSKLDRFDFSPSDRKYAERLIRDTKTMIEKKILKGHVSPRYMALLPMGESITRVALRIFKNGHSR